MHWLEGTFSPTLPISLRCRSTSPPTEAVPSWVVAFRAACAFSLCRSASRASVDSFTPAEAHLSTLALARLSAARSLASVAAVWLLQPRLLRRVSHAALLLTKRCAAETPDLTRAIDWNMLAAR